MTDITGYSAERVLRELANATGGVTVLDKRADLEHLARLIERRLGDLRDDSPTSLYMTLAGARAHVLDDTGQTLCGRTLRAPFRIPAAHVPAQSICTRCISRRDAT